MLETEQEENQEKEREKRKQILHSQELKKQKKKNRLLFGDTGRFNINPSHESEWLCAAYEFRS
jgi:hypothetical protein